MMRAALLIPRVVAAFALILSFPFLVGGGVLASIGGSLYYLLAGIVLSTVGLAYWFRNRWGTWLYGFLIVGTTLWALWEGGLNPWALLPRLGLLLFIGLWLLLPVLRRDLSGGPSLPVWVERAAVAIAVTTPFAAVLPALLLGQFASGTRFQAAPTHPPGTVYAASASAVDWASTGGTAAGTRYSTLVAIAPQNVHRLRVAWVYDFGDKVPSGLQVSPLKIGDSIYACNSSNVVVSLDPDTGRERWRFDPETNLENVPFPVCRGVAYFKVPNATGDCAERIYTNTVDARLIAIDARTGLRCSGFGVNGEVSLSRDLGRVRKGYYYTSSAPTIARGRVVLGGLIFDNQYWGEPSGVIRAFNAISGELAWAYDVGRPDLGGAPPAGQSYTLATPNAWAPMAYDDSLGLVYVPTGNATPDYYGSNRRPMDEEIASSVMALDVETGRRRWVFQTVHHDLWDYDVASPPVLVDFLSPRATIKALIQPTKRGETFLLDRATGEPLDKVIERKVSQVGSAPGERVASTQPFPTQMPSLAGDPLTESMMWGLSPLDQLWCRIKFRQARYEGQMTPPGLTPSIQYPGYLGGMDWGGVSVDTDRGIIVTVTNHVANYVQLISRKQADQTGATVFGIKGKGGDLSTAVTIAVQANLPYAALTKAFLSPLEIPCQQPPWSRLSAINLKSKRVLWSRPLGTGKDNGPLGMQSYLPLTIGVPSLGGSLVTRSDLTFVGASTDRTFRAFQTSTGRMLWQAALPGSGNAHPMTYVSPKGRQMIVIAGGGHKLLHSKDGDKIVAFALGK